MGKLGLPEQPGCETNVALCAQRAVMDAPIGRRFARMTRGQVTAALRAAGTEFGLVNDLPGPCALLALRYTALRTETGLTCIVAPGVIHDSRLPPWRDALFPAEKSCNPKRILNKGQQCPAVEREKTACVLRIRLQL